MRSWKMSSSDPESNSHPTLIHTYLTRPVGLVDMATEPMYTSCGVCYYVSRITVIWQIAAKKPDSTQGKLNFVSFNSIALVRLKNLTVVRVYSMSFPCSSVVPALSSRWRCKLCLHLIKGRNTSFSGQHCHYFWNEPRINIRNLKK